MSSRFLIMVAAFSVSFLPCCGLPEDPVEYSHWETNALKDIREQISKPPEEAIPSLGLWLYKLNLPRNRERGDRPVFAFVTEALRNIPGHANYFERQIREAHERVFAEADSSARGPLIVDCERITGQSFVILSLLPSPETVKVLGEFLYDDHSRPPDLPKEMADAADIKYFLTQTRSNSSFAVGALSELPLVSKPVRSQSSESALFMVRPEDIEPWRLWYEQVRAGTRTFRFEGDSQEYSLAGSVKEARTPPEVRAPKSSDLPPAPEEGDQAKKFPRSALLAAAGALALCVFAAWKVIQARKPQ